MSVVKSSHYSIYHHTVLSPLQVKFLSIYISIPRASCLKKARCYWQTGGYEFLLSVLQNKAPTVYSSKVVCLSALPKGIMASNLSTSYCPFNLWVDEVFATDKFSMYSTVMNNYVYTVPNMVMGRS